eukprot:gene10881-biopygen8065
MVPLPLLTSPVVQWAAEALSPAAALVDLSALIGRRAAASLY